MWARRGFLFTLLPGWLLILGLAACRADAPAAPPMPSAVPSLAAAPARSPSPLTASPTIAAQPSPQAAEQPSAQIAAPSPTPPSAAEPSQFAAAPLPGQAFPSPAGDWLWRWERGPAPAENFLSLRLTGADGRQTWLSSLDPHAFPPAAPSTVTYERPFLWLPKDPYVYLAGQTCCGTDARLPFLSGFWLRRLDLTNGRISHVLGARDGRENYAFSISPLGQYLFSARLNPPGAPMITELSDQRQSAFSLPGAGRVLSWAPDESLAALAVCRGDGSAALDACAWGLWVLDLPSLTPREYIPDLAALRLDPQDELEKINWISRGRLNLHLRSGLLWQLNLVSGALVCQPGEQAACP